MFSWPPAARGGQAGAAPGVRAAAQGAGHRCQRAQPAAPAPKAAAPQAPPQHPPWYLRRSVEFQWFFTALSVRPGSSFEMTARAGQGGEGEGGGGLERARRQQGGVLGTGNVLFGAAAPASVPAFQVHPAAAVPLAPPSSIQQHHPSLLPPAPGCHSRAHLLPCSLCALMITASSHWLKGSFFTSGFSWLHHLGGAAGQRGWGAHQAERRVSAGRPGRQAWCRVSAGACTHQRAPLRAATALSRSHATGCWCPPRT